MHVVFVTMVDPSGTSGENVYSKEVIKALSRKKDVQLDVVCPKLQRADSLEDLGTLNVQQIRRIPAKKPRSIVWHIIAQWYILVSLYKILGKDRPKMILSTLKASNIVPPIVSRLFHIPYVLLVEGMPSRNVARMRLFPGVDRLVEWVIKLNARRAVEAFAAYEEARQAFDQHRTESQSATQLAQAAVDTDQFAQQDLGTMRQELDLPFEDTDFVVGFVGSFKPYHCLPELINATSQLVDHRPQLKLLLVGDGPEFEAISAHVREQQLSNCVHLTGHVSHTQVPSYITACDAIYSVIDPNHWGNPMKCYEALACERPVIIRESPDLAFVARERLGVVVDRVYPDAIAQGIRWLIEVGEEERRSMGDRGRQYIVNHHTWDQLMYRILSRIPT